MEEKPKSKGYVLRKLFFACLYLSTFTFGGGYVIVTLLKEKFVDHYHWIEEDEMLDLVAIAQSSPGAIAVNGAIIEMCIRDSRCITWTNYSGKPFYGKLP